MASTPVKQSMTAQRVFNGGVGSWVRGILTTILLGVAGYMLITQQVLMANQKAIMESRWTNEDQRKYVELTNEQHMAMWAAIGEKADRDGVPTPAVKQRLARIEADIAEVKKDVKTLLMRNARGGN
jgi:hypothetical protein